MDIQKQKVIRAEMADWAETCIRNDWHPLLFIAFKEPDHVEFFSHLTGRSLREMLVKTLEALPSDDDLDKLHGDYIKRN